MGVNCSNCHCTWNEEINNEIKDLMASKYNKGKREKSLPILRKSLSNLTNSKE
jgi:hypothetical protein